MKRERNADEHNVETGCRIIAHNCPGTPTSQCITPGSARTTDLYGMDINHLIDQTESSPSEKTVKRKYRRIQSEAERIEHRREQFRAASKRLREKKLRELSTVPSLVIPTPIRTPTSFAYTLSDVEIFVGILKRIESCFEPNYRS